MDNLFSGNWIPSTSSGRPIASQLSSAAQNGLTKSQCHSVFMRIEIPVTESSFRSKLQNRFTSQRNAYSHANGIPIPIRPVFLFTSQRNVHSHRPEYPPNSYFVKGATAPDFAACL